MRKLTPGARAGLEPATLVVNAGSGCSAAVGPREAVVAGLVTCWYPREIEECEDAAVRPHLARGGLSGVRQTLDDR
jgi:hypothetical protein